MSLSTELREHGAVHEFDHRVDDALRMDDRHRRASIGTSKSQRASIISRPLLKSVAESMVIFAPMSQVGCFSACARVTSAKSVRGQCAETGRRSR